MSAHFNRAHWVSEVVNGTTSLSYDAWHVRQIALVREKNEKEPTLDEYEIVVEADPTIKGRTKVWRDSGFAARDPYMLTAAEIQNIEWDPPTITTLRSLGPADILINRAKAVK